MINMDRFDYQKLAVWIERYHDKGYAWADAQRIALADMTRRYGWRPKLTR